MGELGKWPKSILPDITLKSIIPHITGREARIQRHTATRDAALQSFKQFPPQCKRNVTMSQCNNVTAPVQCHRHHNRKLSYILAGAANSGNYPHFKARMCKPGGTGKGRHCSCTLLCKTVALWCSLCKAGGRPAEGCKVRSPSNFREILSSNCSCALCALSPTTKQKSPSSPHHRHHHHQ